MENLNKMEKAVEWLDHQYYGGMYKMNEYVITGNLITVEECDQWIVNTNPVPRQPNTDVINLDEFQLVRI